MAASPAVNKVETDKTPSLLQQLATGLLFGLVGFAVNWFKLELFFNVDFLFGSIVTMFALLRYGLAAGTLAALVAATCTWHHWHQPWAIIIFTMEAFFAGLLLKKRRWDLSSSDVLFWFSGGFLLVWLFYHQVMELPFQTTLLVALKQGVNGVFNSLVAMALFIAVSYRDTPRKLPSLRQLLFVSLSLFVLVPAMGYFYFDINRSLDRQLKTYRDTTSRLCDVVDRSVSLWLNLNRDTVTALARLVEYPGRMTRQELQHAVEVMASSNPEFKRMAIINHDLLTQASAPLLQKNGDTGSGFGLIDLLPVAALKHDTSSFTYEVFMGKKDSSEPQLALLAPMLKGSDYRGAALGIIDFMVLKHLLLEIVDGRAITITLIDADGRVVISTQDNRKPLEPFALPHDGTLKTAGDGVDHWVPDTQPKVSAIKRWQSSFYVKQNLLGIGNGWKVAIESSLGPQLEIINAQTSHSLGIIALLIVTTIALSHLFAGKLASVFRQLETVTRELPLRISSGEEIVWPAPITRELAGLTDNFQMMSTTIQRHVGELELLAASLEQRVIERTLELHESEKFTVDVMDSLASNIAVLDANGIIIAVNEPWHIFAHENNGMTETGYIGMQYLSVCRDSIGRDDDEGAQAAYGGINAVLQGTLDQFKLEYPCHSPDTQRWFMMNVSKLKGVRGGVVISHTNITERRQEAEELRQAKEAAVTANESQSRFIATVAHEFRTPLSLLTSSTDILDRYGERLSKEQHIKQNGHIRSAARQIASLIDTVLSFNRLETDSIKYTPALQDVRRLCCNIAAEVSTVWGAGRDFQFTMPDDCGTAMLDEILMRRVLENLLTNAFRYTPEGGAVSLQVNREHGRLLLLIKDSGIGIPEEDISHVFEAFYRCRNVEARRGLGLGLSIVREALLRMEGAITVTSVIGEGTAIRVEIPVLDETV